MVRAVQKVLSDEPYASQFSFDTHLWQSPEGQWAEHRYPFGRDRHGFVVVTQAGDLRACRPSHFYGEAEIRRDLDRVLAGGRGHLPTGVR